MFPHSTDRQLTASEPIKPSSHLQVRAAQSKDVAGIAEILATSFHSRVGIWGWAFPLLQLGIQEDIRHRLNLNSPHQICLVAVDPAPGSVAETYAGTVELALRSIEPWLNNTWSDSGRQRCRYPYLSNLAVSPSARRCGVAGKLLLNCERIALSWGCQDIYLHVLENNYQARQLYFKLGYRLHQVDNSWSNWLFRKPRQLLLHKQISPAANP